MNAAEVLHELEARGVELVADGGRLRFRPLEAVDATLMTAVKENKAELLRLVGEPAPLRCFACHGSDFWQGRPIPYSDGTTEPALWLCRRCHPPTPGAKQGGTL
jgi:hypothetical protein